MKRMSDLLAPSGMTVNAVSPGNVLFPGGSWEKKIKDHPDKKAEI